jgi:hypothetical protein
MEYRKRVDLPSGKDYWFVHLGPIPNTPDWHQELYAKQSYPFPTKEAAELFAMNHMIQGREVYVQQGV